MRPIHHYNDHYDHHNDDDHYDHYHYHNDDLLPLRRQSLHVVVYVTECLGAIARNGSLLYRVRLYHRGTAHRIYWRSMSRSIGNCGRCLHFYDDDHNSRPFHYSVPALISL